MTRRSFRRCRNQARMSRPACNCRGAGSAQAQGKYNTVLPDRYKTVLIDGHVPEPFLTWLRAEDHAYDGERVLMFSSKWGLDHLAR